MGWRRLLFSGLSVAAAGVLCASCSLGGNDAFEPTAVLLDRGVPAGFAPVDLRVAVTTGAPDSAPGSVTYQTPLLRSVREAQAACAALAGFIDDFRQQVLASHGDDPGLDVKGCAATTAPNVIGPLDPLPSPAATPVLLWDERGESRGFEWSQHAEYVNAGEFKLLRVTIATRPQAATGASGS